MWQHMPVLHPFLRLTHISLYVDTRVCLSNIFPQPLAAVNYAVCLYKHLFESLLSILKYLGVELLGHIVILFFNEKSHFLLVCLFVLGLCCCMGFL